MDQTINERTEARNDSTNQSGDSLPKFSWEQKQRILSCGIRPKPSMLEGDGFHRLEITCITGETGKRKQDAIWCYVIYDEDYVVERIARELGILISGIGRDVLLKLVTKAKERWREIESEQ